MVSTNLLSLQSTDYISKIIEKYLIDSDKISYDKLLIFGISILQRYQFICCGCDIFDEVSCKKQVMDLTSTHQEKASNKFVK